MKRVVSLICLIAGCLLFIVACGGGGTPTTVSPTTVSPTTVNLDISSQEIEPGQRITISWSAKNIGKFNGEELCNYGSKISVSGAVTEPKPVDCIGSLEERPLESTKYTFGALRNDGSGQFRTITKEVIVNTSTTPTQPPSNQPVEGLSNVSIVNRINGHTGERILSMDIHKDEIMFVTGGLDNNAIIWNVNTGEKLRTLTGHTDIVTGVRFSPDGSRVATSGRDGRVKVWRVSDGVEILNIPAHSSKVNQVVYSPDGSKLVSVGDDGAVKLWNAVTGTNDYTFTGHTTFVVNVDFSPDGRTIATSSWDNTVRLWDTQNLTSLGVFTGHINWVLEAKFSSDGSRIASASWDGTVKVWDVNTKRVIKTVGAGTQMLSVAFNNNDSIIAVGSTDSTVYLWNINGGDDAIGKLTGMRAWVPALEFTSDGKKLIVGAGQGDSGSITIYGNQNGQQVF